MYIYIATNQTAINSIIIQTKYCSSIIIDIYLCYEYHPTSNPYLIEKSWVCFPFEKCLGYFYMAILTCKVEWSKPTVVDAVHEAKGS